MNRQQKVYSIAIDGPTGAGKSTLAKALAALLGYIYVDTGALYRAIGYEALATNTDVFSSSEVEKLLQDISIELEYVDKQQHVFVNRKDVTGDIRTETVSMAASAVSAHVAVRAFLLELQRNIAKGSNVIMDGRDIATVVLPNADVKIFLTASSEERAGRRYRELIGKGVEANYEDVLKDLITRDYNDSHREIAPLKVAEDAIVFDNTDLELETAVEQITKLIRERLEVRQGSID